ncbi:hypothetical protein GCM10009851_31950 [Herbiconiux moechotypicola]|uniref:Uncharacterized protein n=1 Tax=Herbiconiux moechotypicola TaxID=637393 RepID=A0ABN3DY63_9MICO
MRAGAAPGAAAVGVRVDAPVTRTCVAPADVGPGTEAAAEDPEAVSTGAAAATDGAATVEGTADEGATDSRNRPQASSIGSPPGRNDEKTTRAVSGIPLHHL